MGPRTSVTAPQPKTLSEDTQPTTQLTPSRRIYKTYPASQVQHRLVRYRWTGQTFWSDEARRNERYGVFAISFCMATSLMVLCLYAIGLVILFR